MLFNSFHFLIFLPLTLVVYFVLPLKIRWIWLLGCSAYFYMCWKRKYIILIGFSIAATWLGSVIIDYCRKSGMSREKEKIISKITLITVLVLNLGILFVFKYYNFFADNITAITGISLPYLRFALPVGISFYTFQALGYSIDVYRGTIQIEKNPFRYALFVLFFPQLVAGPIERADNLLPQLQKPTRFNIDNFQKGLLIVGWGMFMKVVVADRLSIFVDRAYADFAVADGSILMMATIFFAFQIYCDFASYSIIALGVAKMMGFTLMKNFNVPYIAKSISEFWDRWHISLSSWFKEYIYIPLGGNRKGFKRQLFNLSAVFLISGFWHGAEWTYVVWGALHAVYRIVETIIRKNKKSTKVHTRPISEIIDFFKILGVFALVDFTYIFFRADSISQAFCIIKSIIFSTNMSVLFTDTLFAYGLDNKDMIVAVLALAVLWIVDILQTKFDLTDKILSLKMPVKWVICLSLILSILIFGVYGPQYDATPFIYFQF